MEKRNWVVFILCAVVARKSVVDLWWQLPASDRTLKIDKMRTVKNSYLVSGAMLLACSYIHQSLVGTSQT